MLVNDFCIIIYGIYGDQRINLLIIVDET